MTEVTLSSKNQIVIPREAREALGLKPGDKLLIVTKEDRVIVIERPASFAAATRGMAGRAYPKNYLRKEGNSWR
jgi:AbrB family looped-hinge helix DNA binding protein